jgi:hypothetical protein
LPFLRLAVCVCVCLITERFSQVWRKQILNRKNIFIHAYILYIYKKGKPEEKYVDDHIRSI